MRGRWYFLCMIIELAPELARLCQSEIRIEALSAPAIEFLGI